MFTNEGEIVSEETFIEMIDTRIIITIPKNDGSPMDKLLSCDWFKCKLADGIMPYLELQDIAQQVENQFVDSDIIFIDVWYELGIRGYIYRFNNKDRQWIAHGETRGYA